MTNPLAQIPPKARAVIYILYGVGSIALTYAAARGWVGAPEIGAWTALGGFFGLTAAANTDWHANERGQVDALTILALVFVVLAILLVVGILPR